MKTNLLIPEHSLSETTTVITLPKVAPNGRAFIVDWLMADGRSGAKTAPARAAGDTRRKADEPSQT